MDKKTYTYYVIKNDNAIVQFDGKGITIYPSDYISTRYLPNLILWNRSLQELTDQLQSQVNLEKTTIYKTLCKNTE